MKIKELKLGDECIVYIDRNGNMVQSDKAFGTIPATVIGLGCGEALFGWKINEPHHPQGYDRSDSCPRSITLMYVKNEVEYIVGYSFRDDDLDLVHSVFRRA
jgi:hypothetical protein